MNYYELHKTASPASTALPLLSSTSALREASADDLRILICLAERGGFATAEELADAAGCSISRAEGCLSYWRGAGIVSIKDTPAPRRSAAEKGDGEDKPKKEKRKRPPLRREEELYAADGKEIAETVERLKLKGMIDACQQEYGRLFNQTELQILTGLCDQLGLDEGFVVTLLHYCLKEGKKSLKYMEKLAYSLYDEDVTTQERLDRYILDKQRYKSAEGEYRRMFGMGERRLTAKEQQCFASWLQMGFPLESVGIAYDITVNSTGTANVSYANTILLRWHEANAHTEGEINALREKEREQRANTPPAPQKKKQTEQSSRKANFDADDFFNLALKRSFGSKKD